MKRTSAWLVSAAIFAVASPAAAQTAQSTTDTDKQTAQPTPGGAEGAAVQDQARQQQPVDTSDIVITATRRNEALSDVPMAVSAVTARNLEYTGASDIRQLNQLSPSLLVSSTTSEGAAAVARIRGIGTVGDNPGLEGSVATYIDGVYRSRTGVALTELGPLDRIEVLRGPQGTLFGRNASAGVISIITAKPRFTPEVSGQIDVGNYSSRRLEASVTGPLTDTIAARLDGVWMKRDGFLKDDISGRDVNDRNRWMVRGQLLFQPSDDFSFRLIGDYAHRDEECCAAVFLPAHDTTAAGSEPSTIAAIERALGAVINDDPYRRRVSITPGRNYNNRVKDGGVSGEAVYDMGWAELTSITAYRGNNIVRGQDADFNNLDILFRDDDGGYANRFKTFTQELRLQGNTWNNRLDWLVGGFYANEKLRARDNVGYGADYPRYANCLVAANFVSGGSPASLLAPGASPTCFNPLVAPLVQGGLTAQFNAAVAAGNVPLATAIAGRITTLAAFARLNNVGSPGLQVDFSGAPFGNSGFSNLGTVAGFPGLTLAGNHDDDEWNQTSNNWAIFTHNIFSITDQLKVTVGARYTHEKKDLNAALADNNALCAIFSASPLLSGLQQLPCVFVPSVPGGSFHGSDSLKEGKVSGTVVLSYKPTDRLLTYASYSRGYKAGGFNLDRAALARSGGNGAVIPQDNFDALKFKAETNDAFELGAKFNGRGIDVNLALFHQLFRNFQLNTFNGLNFVVENINGCSDDLGGADKDQFDATGACTGDTRAGVRSQGFELEVFTRPLRDFSWNAGLVMADTKYRDNLVGANGEPLTAALFQLPGRRLSNAPKWTATSSAAWTPPIGNSGMSGLVYADVRWMSKYNTGSDLDIEKTQDAFAVVNGRVGVHGPNDMWGLEFWAQNLFDKNFEQVAFDAPLQGTGTTRGVEAGFYPRATQLYGAFLGEPRTFGVTLRGKLDFARPAPPPYVPPPAPPPPPAVEQPAPPPPPPPPPPVERGERG
jgi:outer membrane receptor protein involved in Fe transport